MANKKGKYTLEEYCKLNNRDDLLQEWDYEKNDMKPSDYASGSGKKVWWKCPTCDNSFEASIGHRVEGTKCPACRGKRVYLTRQKQRVEVGDTFGNVYANLLEEWDYELNVSVDPLKIAVNHSTPVWWKGKCGHSWKTLTRNRIQGKGCPYCTNHKVLEGFNDLKTLNPPFLDEWNYEKNDILPSQVTAKCNKKVWWKCALGHEWISDIRNRYNCGCPYCGNKKIMVGYNDLASTNPELVEEWDYEKNSVSPTEVVRGSDGFYWWKCKYGHSWRAKITNRVHGTNCPECTLYLKTSFPEQAIYYYVKKHYKDTLSSYSENGYELDIYIPHKKVGIEYDGVRWHQDLSKDINKIKKCKNDGIELIRIREKGCPELQAECMIIELNDNHEKNLQDILPRILRIVDIEDEDVNLIRDRQEIYSLYLNTQYENSLESRFPNIASEWNYDRNKGLLPSNISAGNSKKVWWKCKNSHEWEAAVASRTGKQKTGCPYCSGKRVLEGANDIATIKPEILNFWDYNKNFELPSRVSFGTGKKYWWICELGHSWEDTPYQVINNQKPCPYCGRRKLLKGFNDLKTLEPELCDEWNYDKNDILPNDLLVGKEIHVWWKCNKCGNEWRANVQNRRLGPKNSCPKCADEQRIITRRKYIANSGMALKDRFPEIAKEWHPTKNKDLPFDASNVGGTVHINVWWKCSVCNYEWNTQIAARTRTKTGCPECFKNNVGIRVKNITTGEVFQNARKAADAYGCTPGNIYQCCRGKIKSAKGCKWEYI